jgi:uncharacterized protein (DUF3820 family)
MSEYDPNALTDDDKMPWGKYRGQRLGDVPDHYWRWFLQQDWCDEKPEYVEYANLVLDE